MIKYDLSDIFGITIFIVLFFEVWKVSYSLMCPISLIVPLFILIIIGASFYGIKLQQRECFRECFFEKKSFISRILSNKLFIIIIYTFVSIALTISTIYLMLQYTHEMTKYLVAYIFFLYSFYRIIIGVIKGIVRDKFLLLFAKEITSKITSLFAVVGYLYILVNQTLPKYLSENFLETIRNASNTVGSECILIDYILRLKTEIDSTLLWVVNDTTNQMHDHVVMGSVWAVLVLINSLAIIGINTLILEVIYLKLKGRFE